VTLTKLLDSQEKAIEKAGDLLRIKGKVLPVTLNKVDLVAAYTDGTKVVGEHFIDQPKHNGTIKISNLTTVPKASITKKTKEAIENADLIIIGPGGFYTTILATLVVNGVRQAIEKSRAKKMFILNLMTEYGQTYQFNASDFLGELNNYLSVSCLDFVIINKTPIPAKILDRYKKFHAQPVQNDLLKTNKYKIISADVLSSLEVEKQKGDTLVRSLVRHDPEKIAHICKDILHLI
jgi:uncharacterized cofD-like protein